MGMSVADNFLTRLIFIFLFFLVMTMYANEFQTKEKPIQQQQLILLALQILIVNVYIKITFKQFPLKDFLKVNIVINLYLAAVI